jgi:hypothetical protein
VYFARFALSILSPLLISSYGIRSAGQGHAKEFPEYVFVELYYVGAKQRDQHPPTDVRPGEVLLARIYKALRGNEALWRSTLLVVLYDEHGGFYDHVSPPAAVPPDEHTKDFAFDRLEVRVRAILISPWVDPGVLSTQFDHTSLLHMQPKNGNSGHSATARLGRTRLATPYYSGQRHARIGRPISLLPPQHLIR